jgi:hypothetical protein
VNSDFQIAEFMVHMDAPDTNLIKQMHRNRMLVWGISSI